MDGPHTLICFGYVDRFKICCHVAQGKLAFLVCIFAGFSNTIDQWFKLVAPEVFYFVCLLAFGYILTLVNIGRFG